MSSIGIMGGTFNPIHLGHTNIAKKAMEQFGLDEVWFMPNHLAGYKNQDCLVSDEHRFFMIKLAISAIPGFVASDFELKKTGNTYTYETLSELNELYGEHTFYFIMGEDSLDYFNKWKNPEIIVKYAKILVAPRNDSDFDNLQSKIKKANAEFKGEYFFAVDCENIPCSSSNIRNNINSNVDSDNFLNYIDTNVYKYIVKHGLYQK